MNKFQVFIFQHLYSWRKYLTYKDQFLNTAMGFYGAEFYACGLNNEKADPISLHYKTTEDSY